MIRKSKINKNYKKDNLKNLSNIEIILNFIIILICIIFNIFIFINLKDYNINIFIITCCFTIIILGIFYLQKIVFKNYINDILTKLSDMLATISDMNETEVFSMIDDSIFSKLQHQTLRLINILKSQNKKMEYEKNEIKSLISDIAHQLKTPLTNMKIYSEFLQYENLLEEDRIEFNKVIMLSLDKLCFLVESMIKMSRLESSIINLHKRPSEINESILSAITQLYKKAQLKNIKIEFSPKENIKLNYDEKWTTEAIFNIIENAIKYSHKDSTIFINVEKYEIFTRIDIKDEGIGISEEEIPKIFRRFYRGSNVLNEEGIGIGLYLSREIVTKQGGYIKVKSYKNGSIFSIFLPN
ncbi:MAG: HAMP domain-containing sensor histidine kinase [Clostridiales bacterium]|nr:HAMP domain-containing sensor histidine kinase [Clostridiales bacterium]